MMQPYTTDEIIAAYSKQVADLRKQLSERDELLAEIKKRLGNIKHCCRNCDFREPAFCPTKIGERILALNWPSDSTKSDQSSHSSSRSSTKEEPGMPESVCSCKECRKIWKSGWDAGASHWQKEHEAQSALIGELVSGIEKIKAKSVDGCSYEDIFSIADPLIAKARARITESGKPLGDKEQGK